MKLILAVLLFWINVSEAFHCPECEKEQYRYRNIESLLGGSFAQTMVSLKSFNQQFPYLRSLPSFFANYWEVYDSKSGLTIYNVSNADLQVMAESEDGTKHHFSRQYRLQCLTAIRVSENNLFRLREQGLFGVFDPEENNWRVKVDLERWDGIEEKMYSYDSYSSINFLFEDINQDFKDAFAFSSVHVQESLGVFREGIEEIREDIRKSAVRLKNPNLLNETLCFCNKNPLSYSITCEYCLLRSYKKSFTDLQKIQILLPQEQNTVLSIFENAEIQITGIYHSIYEDCIQNHRTPWSYYQRGLIYFHQGHVEKALRDIQALLEAFEKNKESNQPSPKLYFDKGVVESELGLYNEAIASLSMAIEKDPANKESYFERAAAYFEMGDFEHSLQDYLHSGIEMEVVSKADGDLLDFSFGFAQGAKDGVIVASQEFVPAMLSSVRGIGNFLWAVLEDPIENSKMLAAATVELCTYLKTCDKAELAQILVPEMYELVTEWDNLSYSKRGKLAGYCLGKYGTEILLPVAVLKGAKTVRAVYQIKKAEKLCTLKALSSSPKAKDALAQSATRWNEQRKAYFSNVKLKIDSQTKHIPGSWNYEPRKGVWTHPNPEKKLKSLAGTGQRVQGEAGKAGFRERVDCGEIIGYYLTEKGEKIPTTMAIIHYSKKGAHFVPAKPK